MDATIKIQTLFDNYLRLNHFKQITDIQYHPTTEEVIVLRKGINRRNQTFDVSHLASPSEVFEEVLSRAALY